MSLNSLPTSGTGRGCQQQFVQAYLEQACMHAFQLCTYALYTSFALFISQVAIPDCTGHQSGR